MTPLGWLVRKTFTQTNNKYISYSLGVISQTLHWFLASCVNSKTEITSRRVFFLFRNTLSRYDFAICKVSWIYSIRFKCCKPDANFQHFSIFIGFWQGDIIQKTKLARVVLLIRNTLYWYGLAISELSWILSIWIRRYEPDTKKAFTLHRFWQGS